MSLHLRSLNQAIWLLLAAFLVAGCVPTATPGLTPIVLETGTFPSASQTQPGLLSTAFNLQFTPAATMTPGSGVKSTATPVPQVSTKVTSQLSDHNSAVNPSNPGQAGGTPTNEIYPGPSGGTATTQAYPGPQTATPGGATSGTPNPYVGPTTSPFSRTSYPGPVTPSATRATPTPTANLTTHPGISATPTFGPPAPGTAQTPTISIIPTQHPIYTSQPPQNLFQSVTIWHSWSPSETQTLEEVIREFQSLYPNVKFVLTYVPLDELQGNYDRAAYLGNGPSLLLGPADWGPAYYDKGLVADLASIADSQFLATINPAALNEARYRGALIGLPYAIRTGVVMYRNKTILPKAPATFDELLSMSKAATHGGTVGAYLEWSFFFSAAHLEGMGGQLMDQNGDPAFNTSFGIEWLKLLAAFKQAGPIEFNGNRDLDTFKSGKAGIIIDGTWNRDKLAQAIGAQNLTIDPWPAYKFGHLAGYIQTDNIYLNANISGDQRYAALQFMGFFLARQVQAIMVQAGHIPTVMDVQVSDPLLQQEITAFKGAVAYPIRPEIGAYWDPLQAAMLSVVNNNADPTSALQQAFLDTESKIASIRAGH